MHYYDTQYRLFGLTFPRSLTTTIQTRAQTQLHGPRIKHGSRCTATSTLTAQPSRMCSSVQPAGDVALCILCCHLAEWSQKHHADSDTVNSIDNKATYQAHFTIFTALAFVFLII